MKIIYSSLLILILLISACKKEVQENTIKTNHNPPQNNNLIVAEEFYGNLSSESALFQIEDAGDGNLYFLGKLNAADATYDVVVGGSTIGEGFFEYVAGKLNSSGEIIRENHPAFITNRITTFKQASGSFQNGLIIGGYSKNPIQARVLLYDNQLNEFINFTNPEENTWYKSITFKDRINEKYNFIAAGGIIIDKVYFPYISEISINTLTKKIELNKSRILNDYPNYAINDLVYSNSDNKIFCDLNYFQEGQQTKFSVACLNPDFNINWFKIIQYQTQKSCTSLSSFLLHDNKLIVAGYANDPGKATISGKMWDSGFITCLDIIGNQIWQTRIGLTNYTERLFSICIHNGFVYSAGYQSAYLSNKDVGNGSDYLKYANGLISKIDINNGSILSNFTFGNPNYESGFHHLSFIQEKPCIVGWTKYYETEGGYQAWFVKLGGF